MVADTSRALLTVVLTTLLDNSDMRRYICSLFTAYVTVLEARDGAEALELARKHYPTLILSDSDMPRLSGTELLKALRAESSELAYVPFILITAAGGADARADGLLSGATEYLEKPFKSRELVSGVYGHAVSQSYAYDTDAWNLGHLCTDCSGQHPGTNRQEAKSAGTRL